MRVYLIGNGGREAALAWKIAQSPTLEQLWVSGENPGWPKAATLLPANGVDAWVAAAKEHHIDLVVVGPEAPLAEGLADACEQAQIACFGPSQAAARLETSKAFAKEVMLAAGVATAGYQEVDSADPESMAAARRRCAEGNVAIKVDGLAAGKGVFVCESPDDALRDFEIATGGRFGHAARFIVLEDLMVGPEVSVFALCDGTRAVGLPSAQDHKRLGENNTGPNTGGMGAYVPCPLVTEREVEALVASVHQPVLDEMRRRGTPFKGVLYAGFMLTQDGPRLLEFNVRFGDPECQPLMRMWDGDILPWLHGAAVGSLPEGKPSTHAGSSCCVVLASPGYPASSTKGIPIPEGAVSQDVQVFFAGAARVAGVLQTSGGRVLGVTARADSIADARSAAYDALDSWMFEGAQYRRDIASTATS